MHILKRLPVIGLTLALLTTILGCSVPLTSAQIVTNTTDSYAKATTTKVDMNMTMAMDVTGGKQPMSVQMNMNASGPINIKDNEMALTMTADADIPGLGKQKLSSDMYIVDNWVYTKTTLPGTAGQWTKTEMNSSIWEKENQLAQQIELLKTATGVNSLGSETVDGIDCHVLEIKPDMTALTGFINSLVGERAGTDEFINQNLTKLFKSVTVKEWIAKKTYFPAKLEMTTTVEANAADFGGSAEEGEVTMNITMTIKYSDYNKPVNITLPPEAANAMEK
jgi:hypothetical protein